jgi:hypothetical protein
VIYSRNAAWFEAPIWDFVGTCAEVLALLTFVLAAIAWWRSRRRYPPVLFQVGVHLMMTATNGRVGYRIKVTNIGRSTAHIRSVYLVGASVVTEPQSPQIEWLLRSTASFMFDVESPDIGVAWLLIIASSFEDARVLRAAWHPLQQGTPLSVKADLDYIKTPSPTGLGGWWRRSHPHTVGPNHDSVAFMSLRPRRSVPVQQSVIAEITTYSEVELWRPGTVTRGDPKTWLTTPEEVIQKFSGVSGDEGA